MGKHHVLRLSGKIPVFFYIFLWLIPFWIFFADFLNPEDLKQILNPRSLKILRQTLIQSALSTSAALLIAYFPARVAASRKSRLRKPLRTTWFIPFFFPQVSVAVVFSILFGARGPFGDLQLLYTLTAVIIAHSFYNSPIFIRFISSALERIPEEIRETALIDGLSGFHYQLKVEIPLILPDMIQAFFLAFTFHFTSFAVVMSLGGIRFSTFEYAIASSLSGTLDFSQAFNDALLQLAVLMFIFGIFRWKVRDYELSASAVPLEKQPVWIEILSWIYLIFEYGIVFLALAFSFYHFSGEYFTLKAFGRLFSDQLNQIFPVIISIRNSLLLSAAAALITFILAYLIEKNNKKAGQWLVLTGLGLSGAFLATVLFYFHIVTGFSLVVMLSAGWVLIAVPPACTFLAPALKKIPSHIYESAVLDGAGPLKIFTAIDFPLLKNVFISVYLQIFAVIYGEFTIAYTMQIQPFFPLASVTNFSMSSRRMNLESSAMNAFNVIIILLLFLVGYYYSGKNNGNQWTPEEESGLETKKTA